MDGARGDDALTRTQHLLVQAFSSVQVWLEKITPQPTDAAENICGRGQGPPPGLPAPPWLEEEEDTQLRGTLTSAESMNPRTT